MPVTLSDYLLRYPGVPAVYVQAINNSTTTAYVSATPSDGQGLFTLTGVPAGTYTLNFGPTNTGPWTATGDTNYVIADPAASGGSDPLKANLASPTFTGTVTAATATFTGDVLFQSGRPFYNVSGLDYTGATDNRALIQAVLDAVPAGSQVRIGRGTVSLGASAAGLVIKTNNTDIVGAGKGVTVLKYTGTGAAVSTNVAGGATVRTASGYRSLTVDITGAGAGARALDVDNTYRGIFRDLFLNANSNANALDVLNLIGSASKSTYFNLFDNLDITGGTGGNCVKVGDNCNANVFRGGVWDGASAALNCTPTTTTTDTCKVFGTSIQTTGGLITLGGTANANDWSFIDLRCEPSASNFTFTAGKTLRNLVLGGTYVNTTFVNTAADGNAVLRISSGLFGVDGAFNVGSTLGVTGVITGGGRVLLNTGYAAGDTTANLVRIGMGNGATDVGALSLFKNTVREWLVQIKPGVGADDLQFMTGGAAQATLSNAGLLTLNGGAALGSNFPLTLQTGARIKSIVPIQASPIDILAIQSNGSGGGWHGAIDLQVSDSAGALNTALRVMQNGANTQVGLYGVTPVTKAAAVTTPNAQTAAYVQADVTSLKTAIDAIRVALTNIGITA